MAHTLTFCALLLLNLVCVMKDAMAWCRVCLVGDIRLLDLSRAYLEVYSKLTNTEHNTEISNSMPSTVCFVCHRLLQKCHMFSKMARTSNRILQDLLHSGNEITHNTLKIKPRTNVVLNLTLTRAVHLSVNMKASSALVAVKTEAEPFDDEENGYEEPMLHPLRDGVMNGDPNKTEVQESDSNVNADINDIPSRLYCDVCNKVFYKKCLLVKHLQIHCKHEPYSCDRCLTTCTVKRHIKRMTREKQIQTGEKPYSCNRCDKTFTEKHYLVGHKRIHTGQKPYSCNKCPKTFAYKSDLTIHMRVHTGEKPYSCIECSKAFTVKQNLVRHMRIHTGEKPYSCNKCPKTFAYKSNFLTHMRIHTGERPYSCIECSKTFTVKNNLVGHMRIHAEEKPYSCNKCPKTFAYKSWFVTHMRIHTGERPYSCIECSKTFTEKNNLVGHMRTHTGEKPFSCNKCPKTFAYKASFVHHMRVHTGEKPYSGKKNP